MENQNVSKQDCGCSDGCCIPKKKNNLWSKIIFFAIILAAGVIITVKLVGKKDAPIPPEKCCDKTENPTCCPQSKTEE
jgi:hypothetical protein